jgi:hypothetical protein
MAEGARAALRVACDVVVAVAAVLTIVASFWPWFQATLTPDRTDVVNAPSGAASGVYAHPSLWAAVGLAAAQITLLTARYCLRGRLRVPGDNVILLLGSGLVCLLVTADVLLMPRPWIDIMAPVGVPFPWEGKPVLYDGATLVMTWSHGATVAIGAAFASLAAAIASLALTTRAPRSKSARALPVRTM